MLGEQEKRDLLLLTSSVKGITMDEFHDVARRVFPQRYDEKGNVIGVSSSRADILGYGAA